MLKTQTVTYVALKDLIDAYEKETGEDYRKLPQMYMYEGSEFWTYWVEDIAAEAQADCETWLNQYTPVLAYVVAGEPNREKVEAGDLIELWCVMGAIAQHMINALLEAGTVREGEAFEITGSLD